MFKKVFWLLCSLSLPLTVTWLTLAQMRQATEDDNLVYLPLATHPYPVPVIHYFQSNVSVADPGQSIELSWSSSQAMSVTLWHLLPSGQFGSWWDVAPTGSMTYTIPPEYRHHIDFMLFASNPAGYWVSASLSVTLTCPDNWFFAPAPDECPAGPPLISAGAEQPFEHGLMLWVEAQDLIYVLYDDDGIPDYQIFVDDWDEGDLISDTTIIAPAGYYQPLRGFGLVWREQPNVRDRLGWATQPETGYQTVYQATARWRYNEFFILAVDGNVWHLFPEQSGWEKLIVNP